MTSFGDSFSVDTISVSKQFNVEGVLNGGTGASTPDGNVEGDAGDLFFVYGNSTATVNGVYVCTGGTSWTQCSQNNGL